MPPLFTTVSLSFIDKGVLDANPPLLHEPVQNSGCLIQAKYDRVEI